MDVRHLGTDLNAEIMNSFYRKLSDLGIELQTGTDVKLIWRTVNDEYKESWVVELMTGEQFEAKDVILAVGRGGTPLVTEFCMQNKIPMHANAVDIGVRVEMKDTVWSHFSDKIY
jgi:uncharacterized FAD-dependent dehydrogenase